MSVLPSFAYLCNYVVVCPTQVGWAVNDLRKVREEAELNKLKVLVSIYELLYIYIYRLQNPDITHNYIIHI